MADLDRLKEVIEPAVEAEGFALVRVKMIGGTSDPTLQVMAERPDTRQLSLEDCSRLSRRLSDLLDETDPIEHAYRLEVSSPGIDRPLTRLQDFEDWKGHQARIALIEKVLERKNLTGPLLGVDRELIGVDVPGHGPIWITENNIHGAKLLLTDELLAATAPLSAEEADEIAYDETAPDGEGAADGGGAADEDEIKTEGQD